jgi:MinD superfamily P-loop ATPase
VRREAKTLAESKNIDLILIDMAPGVGCPVITSIGGADVVLVVTEPTVSGVHDMERIIQLADFFKTQPVVCVNKYGLDQEKAREVENFAIPNGVAFVGRIPFDPIFTKAMVQGRNIFEYDPGSEACRAVGQIWEKIKNKIIS